MSELMNFNEIAMGALAEKLNMSLEEVVKNLLDPNTDFKKTRKLTITMKFKTDDTRELSSMEVETKTTLAPTTPVSTKMLIGRDIDTGQVVAKEWNNQIKGQVEASEVIESSEGVVNLREVK